MADEVATREAYGTTLAELGVKNRNIVVLDADLSKSTKSCKFAERFPERFFNVGIAEQNLIGTAAGLAAAGKVVFAGSFAVFSTGRCYDQIRVGVAYQNLNVTVVGSHGGLATGEDGVSHQATEDIALMRALPNMKVAVPADATETTKVVEALAQGKGPCYLRLCRLKTPVFFDNSHKFEFGKAVVVEDGKDAAILACGITLFHALDARAELKKQGIDASVVNVPSVKPIDKEAILREAKKAAIVSVEDHQIMGGIGSAIAEVIAENGCSCSFRRLGLDNRFAESGKPAELFAKYGIDAKSIVKAVKETVSKGQPKRF